MQLKNKEYRVELVHACSTHPMASHVEDDEALFVYDVNENSYTYAEDFFMEKRVDSFVAREIIGDE